MPSAAVTSVLVIDDNEELTENIAEILDDLGVEVGLARDADEAIQAFERQAWSLVVTDVRMPGRDGLELLEILKRRSPGTPVLVMTGYADRDTLRRAHESGALAVVHKPIDLDAFLELVERVAVAEAPVLIVDDDASLCSNLADVLSEERGVLPHPAANLDFARRLAEAIDFRAALIDLRLPDGDGLLLARELLHRPDGSRRPVIIMTGYPEGLRERSGEDNGDNDGDMVVLTKPFAVPNLLERLRELV
ncbi:response regulator [Pseudenhygromyxa sp. WMMC2535]|uniref:response regulator n=1 Tax=Pseudenhygromyxa sp. WMMC2535 TaxID=2712867 RepID=UPI001555C814|nr:response regulator [Pseudenhygromyxa sp. WMMC2535]NVB37366.1 response regulator [Pseudenhygromyxa sp. WMMC2535]